MFAVVNDAVTSEVTIAPAVIAQSNFAGVSPESFNLGGSDAAVEAVVTQHWSAEMAQRFKDLSRVEALGELTIQELAELETLTRLRRSTKYPRTADEILWSRRQNSVTSGLVMAVQKYVEFHKATNRP